MSDENQVPGRDLWAEYREVIFQRIDQIPSLRDLADKPNPVTSNQPSTGRPRKEKALDPLVLAFHAARRLGSRNTSEGR
jgi:hypothetical protein